MATEIVSRLRVVDQENALAMNVKGVNASGIHKCKLTNFSLHNCELTFHRFMND